MYTLPSREASGPAIGKFGRAGASERGGYTDMWVGSTLCNMKAFANMPRITAPVGAIG